MFLGPLSLPTLEAGAAVCNKTPSPGTYTLCHEGFGEFAVLVDSQEYSINCPPMTQGRPRLLPVGWLNAVVLFKSRISA